ARLRFAQHSAQNWKRQLFPGDQATRLVSLRTSPPRRYKTTYRFQEARANMTILKFTDGVEIDTSGPPRKLHLHDGWYVVGEGLLLPVADEVEADEELRKLRKK